MSLLRTTFFAACVASALLLPSDSTSQVSAQSGGYLLRFKYTVGQKINYKMNVTSPMMKTPMAMTMMMHTKAVKGSQADVDYVVNTGTMSGSRSSEQKMSMTVDNRGRIVKSSSPGAGQLANLQLPEKPMKLGESWTGTMTMQGMSMKSTYKLIGMKSVGNVPCAQIAVTVSGGMAQVKVNGKGTMFVRLADASLQSSQIASTVNMNQGNGSKPMNVVTTVVITRS